MGGSGTALAAVETSARWWAAALSSARVSPDNSALRSITPSVLDSIGRSLCRSGEALFVIDIRRGRVVLTPTSSWDVRGSDDPETWRYHITLSGPTTTRTVTLDAASVVHVRYAPPPARPWTGRTPLQLACDTGRAAALLEHATSEEFSFVQQQILSPRRNQNEYGSVDSLAPDIIKKVVASFSEQTGSGCLVVPGDLEPRRLGPSPPDSMSTLRAQIENSLLAVHGVSPALLAAQSTGTGSREAFRQLLHGTIKTTRFAAR